MFSTSTQRAHWMYNDPDRLDQLRTSANKKSSKNNMKHSGHEEMLTPAEELCLIRSYLVILRDFCKKFTPTMRKSVIATAFVYMKRFYLNESCMDHHPRDIGITCAYLACKVDEFNVSINEFIKNVNGDCKKAQKTILSNEFLLMKKLRFQLVVHLPFRAVEGFLIDLRARFPLARDKTDLLAPEIDDYLEKAMFTDICFFYTPSQIALAAVCHSAKKVNLDLNSYLSECLFADQPRELEQFRSVSKRISQLIDEDLQKNSSKDAIRKIEKKLSKNDQHKEKDC